MPPRGGAELGGAELGGAGLGGPGWRRSVAPGANKQPTDSCPWVRMCAEMFVRARNYGRPRLVLLSSSLGLSVLRTAAVLAENIRFWRARGGFSGVIIQPQKPGEP
jgi:hypothetical protein